jgi:signal transduction histidine kinase
MLQSSSGVDEAPLFAGLCLPLRVREHSIGLVEAYGPPDLLEQETGETLSGLANQAASALENARLYEELAERELQLRELVGQILRAQEEERRRVAYEVHDGLAQMAAAAHQYLQGFAKRYSPESASGKEELREALELIQQAVREARQIIADLRPTALDDFGLATALRQQVEGLNDEGWQFGYEESLGTERLPAEIETTLFRVAQEAITNVRKHARTTEACVRLARIGRKVRLEVRDEGRGIHPSAVSKDSGPGERVGLSGMRERVSLLGGELEITSDPGRGTTLVAEVPLPTLERTRKYDHEG